VPKPTKPTTPPPKLRPVREPLFLGINVTPYRGIKRLQWRYPLHDLSTGPRTRYEELAFQCLCGVWFGWTDAPRAYALLEKYKDGGCIYCAET
jgi:hypothetical protein